MSSGRRKEKQLCKTTSLLQLEATECGAACLGMILAYHRRYVPLEQLRLDAGISRDGSKASNLLRAARRYGLDAHGYRKEPEALHRIKLPAILHWDFNHFVVLEGFRGNKVFLNDPAQGRRQVSLKELDENFTGVVLCFSPGKEFSSGGQPPLWWTPLTDQLARFKGPFVYLLCAGLLAVLPGLALPAATRVYLDDIIIGNHSDWIIPLLGLIALLLLLLLVVQALRLGCLSRWQRGMSTRMSMDFIHRLLRLPAGFFEGRSCGELVSRIRLNEQVAAVVTGQLAPALLDLFTACFYLALLFYYNPILTWIGLGFALAQLLFVLVYSRWYAQRSRLLIQCTTQLSGVAVSGLTAMESLKAGGNEDDFFQRWSGFQARLYDASQRLQLSQQLFGVLPAFFLALGGVLILSVGTSQVMTGAISVGSFVAFQALLTGFLIPLGSLVNLVGTLQNARGSLQMLADVLPEEGGRRRESSPEVASGSSRIALSSQKVTVHHPRKHVLRSAVFWGRGDALVLDQIIFGYNPQQEPLLEGFSLALPRGKSLALVGASGSGKSTVAKLISGLYQPWQGTIYLAKRPLSKIPRRFMSGYLAVVEQEIRLFAGSIRDNLTLWDASLSQGMVEDAATMACIHDFILTLPGGYDYPLAEDGRNLSGGQRQRLEIARAVLRRPQLLILDEATSALDAACEAQVVENLSRLGCATLVIAHRLSTVQACDQVMIMAEGKIVEQGIPRELAQCPGSVYRKLQEEDRG